jgi:hypothetical protein
LFFERLSRIIGAKRDACIAFLDFVRVQSIPDEPEISSDTGRILQPSFGADHLSYGTRLPQALPWNFHLVK